MSPREEKQFEEIRQKSREKIIKTAFELFALNGYHSTSISKIAEKAEISKGLMYHYFDSKEKLLDEIITAGLEEAGMLSGFMEQETLPHKKLEVLIRATFEMLKTQKEYWKFYTSIIMQVDVMDVTRDKITGIFDIMLKNIQEIFKEIGVDNPELEAYKFGGMMDGICLHFTVFFEDEYPIDEVVESMVNQYCKPENKKHDNT